MNGNVSRSDDGFDTIRDMDLEEYVNHINGCKGMKGYAVQIISPSEENSFILNAEALESVLLQNNVKDKKVVVVSVAGAFRKGKSFFLDFCLRYMNSKQEDDWLGTDTAPLNGFPWRGGCERDTTGILVWSEVFLVQLKSGEEVAVLFMDTQGAFDSKSTVKDCATVFALSTMVSSVQVYNLSQNIQENDLQHLQLFTEYGRLALEDTRERPFQKLLFLVRDWSYPYEAEYGTRGGKKILDRRLQVSDKQHPELQQLRKHIRACFDDISCYLLPHPGLKVATNPHFDGKLFDIESDFKRCLKVLVPLLLGRDNLVLKEVNGKKITCKELVEYFKAYVKIFEGGELPEPKTMLVATAEANNLAAVTNAKDHFYAAMEKICGGDRPYIRPCQLELHHTHLKAEAELLFNCTRKMGGDEFSKQYLMKLSDELDSMYLNFKRQNDGKNIFSAAKTPATIVGIVILMYFVSALLALFGAYALANLFNLATGVALLTLCLWSYIRYTGDMREIGSQIDILALGLWQNILKPLYKQVMTDQTVIQLVELAQDQRRTNRESVITSIESKFKKL